MNKVISEWNKAARAYSEFEESSQYSKFCRNFVGTYFENMSNLKILDAGCGNGEYTHILSKNNNTVVGCDGSTEMLKLASEKYHQYKFDIVDLSNNMPYENEEFDIILCNLVLMDIDPINNIISEFFRIIKKHGKFFFSILHPAFYQAEWEKDESGIVKSKNVTGYITPIEIQQNFWSQTMHYHRPISYYFNIITDMGFSLKKISEPKVYEDAKIPDIPLYLFAEFQKN